MPGTGRAVELALDELPGFDGDVLVLSGDVPLLEAETLARLVSAHRAGAAAATVLSANVDDATGYGRVIRDADGAVRRIVEQKDATDDEASVTEINAGVYVFQAPALRAHLALVGTANAQGEKYLTDVVALLRDSRLTVAVSSAPDAATALGVNDRVQLAEAARVLNARTVRRWQLEGATILDPATTWIDVDAKLAPDVTVLPNTHILRATVIGEGALIGPDTSLVDCEVGEGATVTRTDATLAVIGAGATVGSVRVPPAGHLSRRQGQDRHVRRDEELHDRRPQQGPAPVVHRRHHDRHRGEPRRRRDHRELRRHHEASHRDRRRGAHRLAQRVRRAR